MQDKLTDFVIFPRQIARDFIGGKLTGNEYLLLCSLRGRADPYGVVTTSLSDIRYDVFKAEVSENYANKLLLSLKRKHRLYFKSRKGHKGSFDIHFGEWILPDKHVRSIEKLFDLEIEHSKRAPESQNETPKTQSGSQRSTPASQRSEEIKDEIRQILNGNPFE